MVNNNQINLEVVFAKEHQQKIVRLSVAEGTTLEDAIKQSGILTYYPEIDLTVNKIGVYGKLKKLDVLVEEGDRIEIYRPLIADPKAVRKAKAEAGKDIAS